MLDKQTLQTLEEHLESKLKNQGAYANYKQPDKSNEMGKNKDIMWVWSSKKALWLSKPINAIYSLNAAVKDVFFGELAVALYGDKHAPKTKFNLQKQGILSKLVSQDRSVSCDLYNFINREGVNCNRAARINLMHVVIFSAIIENRDVRIENIVVQYNKIGNYFIAYKIHSIDYEFVAPHPIMVPYNNCTLSDLLQLVFKDYKIFVNYIFSNKLQGLPDSVKWNLHKINPIETLKLIKCYTEIFTLGIKQDCFIDCFKETVNRICADNYKIYDDMARKIETKLNQQKTSIYPVKEISEQIQKIIERQKSNMRIINKFISEYDQQQLAEKQQSLKSKCT